MSSRLRENPKRLFEVFFEIGKQSDTNKGGHKDPFIIQLYPPDFKDEEVIKNVPKFAFPCDTERSTVDHFTFVLIDIESRYRFGFCRHATGAQTCLCIISYLPWFDIFYHLLNILAEVLNRSEDNDITVLLRQTYVNEVPIPGVPVTVVTGMDKFNFTAPELGKLPSIQTNRNLLEYYSALDTSKMMIIFASMLNERRILFTSKKLSRLTACVHASAALLHPMCWQHVYIPVLPADLVDYISAPMPYLIGIHSTLIDRVHKMELGDAVIVDADLGEVETEFDDLEELPWEVSSYLNKQLKGDKVKNSMGDVISRAFLMALVRLIGGYRDALRFRPGEPITFDPESFVQSRPIEMKGFLSNMLQQQIFEQFINERLDMLNNGEGFTDIFEEEATKHADKLNASSRYKEWLSNMKKQGKKVQKGSKDVWSDFKDKMKTHGKKAYSGIKSKIGDLKKEEGTIKSKSNKEGSNIRTFRDRPSTIVGPELKPHRPPRPALYGENRLSMQSLQIPGKRDSQERKYNLISIAEVSPRSVDDTDVFDSHHVGVKLEMDPDVQSSLHKSVSAHNLTGRKSRIRTNNSEDSLSSGRTRKVENGNDLSDDELSDRYLVDSQPCEALVNTSLVPHDTTENMNENPSNSTATNMVFSDNFEQQRSEKPMQKRPVPRPRLSLDKIKVINVKDRLIAKPPVMPPRVPLQTGGSPTTAVKNSSESEPDVEHFETNSSLAFTCDTRKHKEVSDSKFYMCNHPSRSSLNRVPAFNRHQAYERKKHNAKPDIILTEPVSLADSGMFLFDPLSSSSDNGSGSCVMNEVARHAFNDNELLHSWDMTSLLTSPALNTSKSTNTNTLPATNTQSQVKLPSPCRRLSGSTATPAMNNPIYFNPPRKKISPNDPPRPIPRTMEQTSCGVNDPLFTPPSQTKAPKPPMAAHKTSQGVVENPLYVPPSQTAMLKPLPSAQTKTDKKNDPFHDLVNLSAQRNTPSSKWQRFN